MKEQGWHHPFFVRLIMFVILFGLWLILSGVFYPEFIAAGVIASAAVVLMTRPLMHPAAAEHYEPLPRSFRWLALTTLRLPLYLLWLTKEIALANVQVTHQVLHPSLPIAPRIMRFRTALRREPSVLLFAHSMTLTPGTVTIALNRDEFVIHALSHASVQPVQEGRTQRKIAHAFGEGDPPGIIEMEVVNDVRELQR
jgi:multicomponent Na+:H+ antiporter subunit E